MYFIFLKPFATFAINCIGRPAMKSFSNEMRVSSMGIFNHISRLILIAAFCSLTFRCTSTKQTPKILDEGVPNVHLAYQIEQVEIIDNRKNVSASEMKIPTFSTPKSYTRHSPAVTEAHRQEIEYFCKNNVKGSGPSVQAIVRLVESYKEFSATISTERERGYVKLEVILYDLATDKELISCVSTSDFGVESRDASQEKMEKVYRYALRKAVYKCFKSIAANNDEES
jgi:hypothetical protein